MKSSVYTAAGQVDSVHVVAVDDTIINRYDRHLKCNINEMLVFSKQS